MTRALRGCVKTPGLESVLRSELASFTRSTLVQRLLIRSQEAPLSQVRSWSMNEGNHDVKWKLQQFSVPRTFFDVRCLVGIENLPGNFMFTALDGFFLVACLGLWDVLLTFSQCLQWGTPLENVPVLAVLTFPPALSWRERSSKRWQDVPRLFPKGNNKLTSKQQQINSYK